MDTPLTEEQQQLISAWLDGEVTDAEKQVVAELLKREDAKQYLESLRATTALVAAHGPVRAPVGLSGRVLSQLENDFKPKAIGPGSEPFESIPTISWRTPLYAVAAAVIVSLGIMFGPSLFGPGEATPSGVARGALDNLAPTDQAGATPSDEVFDRDLADDSLESLMKDGGPAGADAQKMRKDLRELEESATEKMAEDQLDGRNSDDEKGSWGGGSGAGDNLRRADKSKETQDPQQDPAEAENNDAAREPGDSAGRPAQGKTRDGNRAESDGGDDRVNDLAKPKADQQPPAGNAPNPERSKKEPNAKNEGGETDSKTGAARGGERDRRIGGGKSESEPSKKSGSSAPSPAPPETPSTEDGEDGKDEYGKLAAESVRIIEISDAHTLTAQTDVLWVSNLYGEASVSDEESDVESISVEVDADKVPELLAALRKLAHDQGYGEVDGEAQEENEHAADKGEDRRAQGRITGYLPPDDEAAGEAPRLAKPDAPAEPTAKAVERVKLVITLK
ncbi:MAG: hypothetical protein H6839_03210 [Planctomycetes bacterium]|nr:hypothetical protein [Planctomycetota bacterium]